MYPSTDVHTQFLVSNAQELRLDNHSLELFILSYEKKWEKNEKMGLKSKSMWY